MEKDTKEYISDILKKWASQLDSKWREERQTFAKEHNDLLQQSMYKQTAALQKVAEEIRWVDEQNEKVRRDDSNAFLNRINLLETRIAFLESKILKSHSLDSLEETQRYQQAALWEIQQNVSQLPALKRMLDDVIQHSKNSTNESARGINISTGKVNVSQSTVSKRTDESKTTATKPFVQKELGSPSNIAMAQLQHHHNSLLLGGIANQVTASVAQLDAYLLEAVAVTRSSPAGSSTNASWRKILQEIEDNRDEDNGRIIEQIADLEGKINSLRSVVVEDQKFSLNALKELSQAAKQ